MKFLKITLLLFIVVLSSCASTYKSINPNTLIYRSKSTDNKVDFEYKYELLSKKYQKKEVSKGVKLVAVKITNNSDKDLVFGKDVKLIYDDESLPYIMENEKVYTSLKQSTASYLFYLLLAPVKLFINKTENGMPTETSSFPIGFILGPALAGGNMAASSSANTKFEKDLLDYNINGATIEAGKTISGLIGIRSNDYTSIKIKVE
ncbi:hypothetical protein [uncultured Polaribacter sp.]|uniref:hypothetical protein n=1 Tax=uncultured Polaribacter sp. TaxID=174711 RepID=UPI0026389714|nr:hypothetical protein [uncultured Polaribacter sp.]